MKKENIKKGFLHIAATGTIAALIVSAIYAIISDLDKPTFSPLEAKNARAQLDDAYQERYQILGQAYDAARDIATKKAALDLGYDEIDKFYETYPSETRTDSLENAIEKNALNLFNEYLVHASGIEAADENIRKKAEYVKKLEQDSIAFAKHSATPKHENFKRNWNKIKKHFEKTR